jgi:purine catabolism regulator
VNALVLRDLLRIALPSGTTLLTHASGAMRPVHGVVGLRTTAPALPVLRAGDLVVMSVAETEAIDDALTLTVIIARLANTTVAGLAVIGPIEERAKEAANEQGLALLHLPPTAEVRTVIREVSLLLESPEVQVERRAAQLYSHLTSAVARGEGITGVLRAVSQSTGCAAAFYDAAAQLQSQYNVNGEHAVLSTLRPQQTTRVYTEDYVILVQAIDNERFDDVSSQAIGFVALCAHEIDRWDEAAAAQAAAALMLELAKQQAVEAVEARVGGELLQTIMSGLPSDMVALQEHASELGYDLRRSHVALVIAPADNQLTIARLRERLEHELRMQRTNAPYVEREHSILCMYPTDERLSRPMVLLRKLAQDLAISAGLSRSTATAGKWQEATSQAEQALTLGRYLFGARSVMRYDDLPVYRLLFDMRASEDLQQFYEVTLGALVEYDRRHNAALLQTLEGYFAAHGNLSQAAESLHIHRNTLVYRLRRISEIGGLDMERSEDTLALQVALKAYRVLQPTADH